MTTPITPRDLFLEFTAYAEDARAAEDYDRQQAYNTAVDLVDGMTKGATMNQWENIYAALRQAAKDNRNLFVILNNMSNSGCDAWNDIMGTMDTAIESCHL